MTASRPGPIAHDFHFTLGLPGATVLPAGQLALATPFWPIIEVRMQPGLPSSLTLGLPRLTLAGPLKRLEMTPPPAVPASSPLDIEISVFVVAAFLPTSLMRLHSVPPLDCAYMAMLTSGVGTGPPGVGTLTTSGAMKHWPPPLLMAGNMMVSFTKFQSGFRRNARPSPVECPGR